MASVRVSIVLLVACVALLHQASAVDVQRSRSRATRTHASTDLEAVEALERQQAEMRALLEDAQPAPAAAPTQPSNVVPLKANQTLVPVSATGKPPAVPAAAAPAQNATGNRTRRIDTTTGYGMFTGLLTRVLNNVNAEKRALFTSSLEQSTECNTSLTRINTSLASNRGMVETARLTIENENKKIFAAQWELNTTILPLLNFKRRQLYSVNATVVDGNMRRDLERRIFANKTVDAQTILNAVNAVTVLLNTMAKGGSTPVNGTNTTVAAAQARFRETMEAASSQVHDPELMRFVEATMQTFQAVGGNNATNSTAPAPNSTAPANATTNANGTVLPGPETDAMRLLLNLLRTQISQYMAQLSRADVANNETWTQTRVQLNAQMTILVQEVAKLDADRLREETRIITSRALKREQRHRVNRVLMAEIAVLEKEQATFLQDCEAQRIAALNQTTSLDDQIATVRQLEKLDFTRSDESVLKRIIESIKLPPLDRVDNTGKRCCRICRRGRKACGNACILNEEVCRAAPGCACDVTAFKKK